MVQRNFTVFVLQVAVCQYTSFLVQANPHDPIYPEPHRFWLGYNARERNMTDRPRIAQVSWSALSERVHPGPPNLQMNTLRQR